MTKILGIRQFFGIRGINYYKTKIYGIWRVYNTFLISLSKWGQFVLIGSNCSIISRKVGRGCKRSRGGADTRIS